MTNLKCSDCGKELELKEKIKMKRPDRDVRKCSKCGYISDIGARLAEDEKFVQYQLAGVDPQGGRFNREKGIWVI